MEEKTEENGKTGDREARDREQADQDRERRLGTNDFCSAVAGATAPVSPSDRVRRLDNQLTPIRPKMAC